MRAILAATLAFRGATLIDGTGAAPISDSLLVVSDGRIVSVGPATPEALEALPPETQIIAAAGKWIVPGWIDAHVHGDAYRELSGMLRWGVTSARLMAEDVHLAHVLAKPSRKPTARVPELFPAVPIFTREGGWWDSGRPPDENLNRFPSTAAEAREAVRKAKALGSVEIKLMLDDMSWCRSPKEPLLVVKAEVVRALLSQARQDGLRASVHAPNLVNARKAIMGGATALAHGILEPIDAKTVAAMKKRSVFYIPTIGIFEFLADTRAFVDSVLSDPRAERGLPPETVTLYRSSAYSDGYRVRYPNFENVKKSLPILRQNLTLLHRAGVPIALGTDMWAFPGLGVSIEMDLYVRAGLSPLEAIRAATETSARSLGLEKERGTLTPGKRADFLILTADPLEDVKNTRAIEAVYKAGALAWSPRTQGQAAP